MSAFERFVAREDRLSALLLALPEYEAPERLAARIQEAALSLSDAEKHRPVENSLFVPPDSLEQAVLRQAGILHAAQSARRRAILRQVAQEDDLSRLFGGPLSQETENWLRHAAQSETQNTPTPEDMPAPFWHRWRAIFTGRHSFALGWAFCLIMLGGLFLRLYNTLLPGPDTLENAVREATKTVVAEAENPGEANKTAPIPAPEAPSASEPLVAPPLSAAADAPAVHERSKAVTGALRKPSPSPARAFEPVPALEAQTQETQGMPDETKVAAALPASQDAARIEPSAVAPHLDTQRSAPAAAPAPPALESQQNAPSKKKDSQAAGLASPPELAQARSPTAMPQNPVDLVIRYPANAPQWQSLAATLRPPHAEQTFVWQLFAGDTKNAEVQALADFLRRTLPDGHTLSLRADPDLAAIETRLERQTLDTR
jgi:hypothetical protein